jgi:hypothetical protein
MIKVSDPILKFQVPVKFSKIARNSLFIKLIESGQK